MESKVGIVESINDGKFFAKDSLGNTKELKNGDIIYENDVVFSDGSNSSNSEIRVALEGEDIIVLKNGVQQLFDSSLIASTFGDEEVVFTRKGLEALLQQAGDITNVESDLRWTSFDDYVDITEEETTAGEEEEEILEEGSIGQFASRDGDITDIVSDLRKKSWIRTQNYKEVENSEDIEKESLKPLGNTTTIVSSPIDRPTSTPIENITPPTVTPPTVTPPTVTPPPITPPTVTPPQPTLQVVEPKISVYVKLINSDTVKEGLDGATDLNNSTLKHYIQLVDKDGKPVEIPAGKSINVTLEYKDILGTVTDGDFKDGGDFKNKVTITLDSNSPKDANGVYIVEINNPAIFDNTTEDLEIYELSIKNITQNGNPFENVTKHPTQNTVTGAIYDTNPTPEKIETTEDNSKDLTIPSNIKDMFVDNGKGFVKVPNNGEVILYDNDKPIGTITYDKDNSKFTFKPYDDYSDYTKSGDVEFLYYAVKDDDSTEFKNVTVEVTPVADAPTINASDVTAYEDASNYNIKADGNKAEGTNKIPLSLIVPSLSKDQTDKNTIGAGDHLERNGEITLKFTNGASVNGAELYSGDTKVATITTANQEVKVVIVKTSGGTDIDTDYHHEGTLPAKGENVLYLTKTEYENLKIQHKEDNDTDIKINIGVTSYEVDDSGKPLSSVAGESDNKDMTVKILPVTDDIKIIWDTATGGQITAKDGKDSSMFTFDTKTQSTAKTTIDLKSIMNNTSGAENGTNGAQGDLDGSEVRTYNISGLPEGAKVTIGGQEKIVDGTGSVTINLSDTNNKVLDHSDFKIELPAYFSGTINGKITLSAQDKGVEEKTDSTKWGEVKSDSIEFKYVVTAQITGATTSIGISQDGNLEDAGRENSNYENNKNNFGQAAHTSNGNITDPTKGIKLIINPQGGNANPYEKLFVSIDKLPVNSALWIYDSKSGTNKLVGVEADGKIYEYTKNTSTNEWTIKTELAGGTIGNIKLEADGTTSYKVTIKDYKNDTNSYPKFIPPHNAEKTGSSNSDKYNFDIEAKREIYDLDGTVLKTQDYETGGSKIFPMYVEVKGVADEPINTALTDDASKFITIDGTKYIKAVEDTNFYLKDIYKNTPSSYDNDGSETLFIKVTLPSGYSMEGYDTKDGNVYNIKASNLDNAYIKLPANVSGKSSDITLQYITQETSGDSKTHYKENIKLFIEAVVDDVTVASGSTIYEDNQGSLYQNGSGLNNKINIQATLKDTDNSESVEQVKILVSSVPAGYKLYSDSSMTTSLDSKIVDGYYVLTKEEANSVYGVNTVENKLEGNFNLTVVYTVKDTDGQNIKTQDFTKTHTVTVEAITDTPTLSVTGLQSSDSSKVEIKTDSPVHGNPTATIKQQGDFTISIKTQSPDTDGSENVVEVELRGVPDGTVVEGARWAYQSANNNNVWIIDGANLTSRDKNLDTDGSSMDIKFTINSANFTQQDITIITKTKDGNDYQETATQKVQLNNELVFTPGSGGGNGSPIIIDLAFKNATIYEDNDSVPSTPNIKDGQYYIGNSITVSPNASSGTDGGKWTVTITDLPAGVTLEGANYSYSEDGKIHYVISGTYIAGNSGTNIANDVQNKLDQIKVHLPADKNSSQDNTSDKFLQMKFTATIQNESAGRYKAGTSVADTNKTDILPVSDEMTIAINVANTTEDTAAALTITLSNPNDGNKTELIGNAIYIKVTENWKDTDFVGNPGTLTDTSGKYDVVWDASKGSYKITPKNAGDNFTVGSPITGLSYTPAQDRAGSVRFDVSTQNKETNSSVIYDSSENKTINVTSVWDFTNSSATVSGTSTEDTSTTIGAVTLSNAVKLNITTSSTMDTSEKYTKVVLDGIPNGLTVYYKNSSGVLVMAANQGSTITNGKYTLNPNDSSSSALDRNKWQIPVGSNGVIPEIYVSAPTNWSGEFNFNTLLSLSEYGLADKTFTTTGNIKIDAFADGVTGSATKNTDAYIYNWTNLNLNAQMTDTDKSEVLNLKLSGLSADAKFALINGDFASKGYSATRDESDWEIKGIKFEDIGNLKFMDTNASNSVTATGTTQELDTSGVAIAGKESAEHNFGEVASIQNMDGTFKFNGAEFDFSNVGTISSKLTHISTIDLRDSSSNEIKNLKLQDLLDMGVTNEIKILGGTNDKVSFKNDGSNTWTKGATVNEGGIAFDVYSVGESSTKLVKVQTDINDQII
ncbi:hypothetical protein N5T77_05380 [Aliarcobacter cryaerophilus]|uniref:hypothetical protein n=1 Tax=Aliarcobacter cryaerophilus TaxID=28198 RepID=UPI0021B50289|nr:hypothetical protein [Aliarcobacter cryaerophilus]MCT7524464.1 hypothetical protein [Aliarcobacter cryaerophilus]